MLATHQCWQIALHCCCSSLHLDATAAPAVTEGIAWSAAAHCQPHLTQPPMQVLTRRLHIAPQKLIAAGVDVQAVQSAVCACLAAAFGTKTAYPSVHSWLHAQAASTSVPSQGLLISTLLELSLTGEPWLQLTAVRHQLVKEYSTRITFWCTLETEAAFSE